MDLDLKKIGKGLGAVAWGTASVIGCIISECFREKLHDKAKQLGDNSFTSSSGRTYTSDELEMNSQLCKGYRDKCERGLSKAKDLWNSK